MMPRQEDCCCCGPLAGEEDGQEQELIASGISPATSSGII